MHLAEPKRRVLQYLEEIASMGIHMVRVFRRLVSGGKRLHDRTVSATFPKHSRAGVSFQRAKVFLRFSVLALTLAVHSSCGSKGTEYEQKYAILPTPQAFNVSIWDIGPAILRFNVDKGYFGDSQYAAEIQIGKELWPPSSLKVDFDGNGPLEAQAIDLAHVFVVKAESGFAYVDAHVVIVPVPTDYVPEEDDVMRLYSRVWRAEMVDRYGRHHIYPPGSW